MNSIRDIAKGIFKDSALYSISQIAQQLTGFLLLPIYAKHLTIEEYGVMSVLSLLPMFLSSFANLGLNNAVFRFYKDSKENQAVLLGTAHFAVLLFVSAILLLSIIYREVFSKILLDSDNYTLEFNIAMITAWATTLSAIPMVVLKQMRAVKKIVTRNLIALFINITLSIYLVIFQGKGVLGSLIGTMAGALFATGFLFIDVGISIWYKFSFQYLKKLLSYSLPYVPYFFLNALAGTVDQVLVSKFLGLHQAGLYGMALRFTLLISLVLNSYGNAWAAFKFAIKADSGNPDQVYAKMFDFYIVFSMSLWVLYGIWGRVLMNLMLPTGFDVAIIIFPLLLFIPIIKGIRGMLTTGVDVGNNTLGVPVTTIIGLIFMLLFIWITSDNQSIYLIPVSNIIFWIVSSFGIYWYASMNYYIRYNWSFVVMFILFSSLFILASSFLSVNVSYQQITVSIVLSISFLIFVILFIKYSSYKEFLAFFLHKYFKKS